MLQGNNRTSPAQSKCPICFKIMSRKSLLRHVRIHSGEKPFACHSCDYRSNQSNNLNLHIRKYHNDVNWHLFNNPGKFWKIDPSYCRRNSLTNFYVHEAHSFTRNGNVETKFEKICEIVSAYGKTLRLQYVQLQGRTIGQLDRTYEDSHRWKTVSLPFVWLQCKSFVKFEISYSKYSW